MQVDHSVLSQIEHVSSINACIVQKESKGQLSHKPIVVLPN